MKPGELRRDVKQIRAFVQRGRERAAESARERQRAPLKRKRREKPAEGPLTPREWRRQVALRAHLRCAVTRAIAEGPFDRRFEVHHVISKDRLKKHGLHMKLWDPRNGVFIAQRVHQLHTDRVSVLPRSAIPASAWAFAAECGTWAERFIEENYV